jgi:hypothetical protein
MEAKHVVTQMIGTVVAIGVARWGWNEFRSDWRDQRRLPLVSGPYMGGRTVLVTLAAIAVIVPVWLAPFAFRSRGNTRRLRRGRGALGLLPETPAPLTPPPAPPAVLMFNAVRAFRPG